MASPSTSLAADEAPPYPESLNVNEWYVHWGEQQLHQNDISFCCDISMPADSTASSYSQYIQLAFPNGTMFVFETFIAMPKDWTALFTLDSKNLYLQPGVLACAALDPFYPILLFLALGPNHFIPNIYNAVSLYPHYSLEAAKIDQLIKTLIFTFHNVPLTEVVPADMNTNIYPMLSQVASPDTKTLTRTIHLKLLTTPKMPKKKQKKQKDKWNQSPKVSYDEDPSVLPRNMYNDPKCLQAAVASAMKSSLMLGPKELLGIPVSSSLPFTN
uniref:Uncharacterized protein n=1 Tax=Romanomermis culicivorax TaxID=13658 RepID=A0A915IXL6_ROMCU